MCARMCTHVCVCVCFGGGQGVGGLGGRGGGREDSSMGSDVMVGKPGRQRCGACTTHPAQLLLPHAHTDTRTPVRRTSQGGSGYAGWRRARRG
jgi:hypothetical protein